MRLFNFKSNKQSVKPLTEFNRYDLELKAKNGKPLTAEEYEALDRFRTHDIWDQVFKVAGVITILFIIMLAVFIFLYPYSLFNVFPTSTGKGDVFWKMLGCWHVYVGKSDTWLGMRADNSGYVEMQRIYDAAFQSTKDGVASGFDFKCGVYVLGSWTIVVVATLGFLAAIIGAAYILAANIKNLIGVVKHVTKRTGDTFQNIGATARESYEESMSDTTSKARKPRTTKKKEPKVVEEAKEEVEDLSDTEEKEVAARVAELKEELAQEEKAEQPKIVPVKEAPKAKDKYDSMSDKDIDKLLGGM